MVESAKTPAPDHVQAVRRMVEHSQETGRSLRYCSSYTILPELREDRELVAQLKIYITGMHALFHDEYQTAESLLGGVVRFKTDQYFASWGYERLALDGQELGTISNATLFGEPVYVMRLNQWSPHALQCAKETRELWNSRLTAQLSPGVPTG